MCGGGSGNTSFIRFSHGGSSTSYSISASNSNTNDLTPASVGWSYSTSSTAGYFTASISPNSISDKISVPNDFYYYGSSNSGYTHTFHIQVQGTDLIVDGVDRGDIITNTDETLKIYVSMPTTVDYVMVLAGLMDNAVYKAAAGTDPGTVTTTLLAGSTILTTTITLNGSDTYYIYDANSKPVETVNGGYDYLYSYAVSYIMPDNIEFGWIYASSDADLSGNASDNVLYGNEYKNVISGLGGSDTIYAFGGDDVLDGGTGIDSMYGGRGNDVYYLDNLNDRIGENFGEGTDTVHAAVSGYTLTANVENLVLDGLVLNGTGNDLANVITGNDADNILDGKGGADTLIGGVGADTMIGGDGNDVYYVDNVGDAVTELAGQGVDTVHVSVNNYILAANVENMIIDGTDAINVFGNELDNVIYGNSGRNVINAGAGNDIIYSGGGDDWLDGNEGADTFYGGSGNTQFVFDNSGDKVLEEVDGGGTDSIWASVTVDLRQQGFIENLRLTGTGNIDGTGNELNNLISGNSGNNVIAGNGGIDSLYGKGGSDQFLFSQKGSANKDSIWDFSDDDAILLDRTAFTGLIATADGYLSSESFAINKAVGTSEQVIYNRSTGVLSYDSNGTKAGGAEDIAFVGKNLAFFGAEDVFLV